MLSYRSFSIYRIFNVLCWLSIASVVAVFSFIGPTTYVNEYTMLITSTFGILILFIVRDSKKENNQLLVVLSWWCLFFYIIRVITLNYTDYSNCLKRCDATATDVNIALVIGIISVICLWVFMRFSRCDRSKNTRLAIRYDHTNVNRALIVYWIAFVINIIAEYELPLSGIASIVRNFILNINDLLYLFLAYVILVWKEIKNKEKKWVLISLVAYVAFVTLNGSRAGFYNIAKMLFFIFLSLGFSNIRKKYIYGLGVLLPVMFAFFIYSSFMRQMNMQKSSLSEKIELVGQASEYAKELDTKLLLGPVFDRIGFLDMTTEMVANSNHLKKYVNFETEFKSIIDNALSPGFDLFDAPKISNIISNSYEFGSNVLFSKTANSKEDYHSDELTAFGEAYLLFNVPLCFVFLSVVGIILHKIWKKAISYNNEKTVFLKSMCLYLFELFLSSYGFDWLMLYIVCFVITYLIYVSYVFGGTKHHVKTATMM